MDITELKNGRIPSDLVFIYDILYSKTNQYQIICGDLCEGILVDFMFINPANIEILCFQIFDNNTITLFLNRVVAKKKFGYCEELYTTKIREILYNEIYFLDEIVYVDDASIIIYDDDIITTNCDTILDFIIEKMDRLS